MKDLTERQAFVFKFIKEYIGKNHYAPCVREIAEAFRISPKGAWDYLMVLHKKGFINYIPNIARGIVIKEDKDGKES